MEIILPLRPLSRIFNPSTANVTTSSLENYLKIKDFVLPERAGEAGVGVNVGCKRFAAGQLYGDQVTGADVERSGSLDEIFKDGASKVKSSASFLNRLNLQSAGKVEHFRVARLL